MSIKATGQITLVDLTDGQLSVYLASNLPKTQIYNSKDESFSPDWRETNLQIVPNISLNQRTINLNDVTITYKKQVGTGTEQNLDGTTEVVNNKILTVNTNVLDYNNAKTVTYFAYINYNNLFSARADITFSLLNEGVDGDEGGAGADGYTFILSNESYIFKGGVGAAQTDQVATTLTAYKGAIEQNVKIKSVNGVTASTTSYSTGITGLTFKVSSTASVKHPSITFNSTAQLTQSNGNLAIQFECDGKTWTKFFSYGVALTGADAINYWMIVSSAAINRDDNSGNAVFSPNQFTLEAKNNVGATGVSNYYARFIIEGTTNNSTWTTLYTSSQNEISKTYTITNNIYIAYRCSMYLAGGTTTLLDRQLIPVVFDGMDVKGLSLTSSSYIVSYDNKGDLKDNTNITLTANQQNFTDAITWTTSPNVTLSGSGLTRTLNPSVFDDIDKVTVTISAGTFTDSVTITKIVDGANAYSVGVRSINFDAVDKASTFFINGNLIETLPISVDTRGYILYTLSIDDLSILSRSHYDTWLYPDTATDLANEINAITDPCIIVLVQVDASTVNDALRSAIASIGGKQTGTWYQERRSHYVVGMPGLTIGQGYEDWGNPSENVTKMIVVPVTIGSGIALNGTNTFTHIKYSDDGGQTFSYPDSIVSKNFNDWIIGHWRVADGAYEENAKRICCPNLVPIEQGIDYYFNTYNSDYKFVIRLYDENKEFLSSIGAKNNGSIMLTNTASYFGVSLYKSTGESSASSSEYMRLFETGELIPVICKYSESERGDSAAAYIGVYYDNVDEDSTNPADYTWTKLTGDESENVDPEEPKSPISIILSNEAQNVYADENGNVSVDEIAKVQSDVTVYVGTEEGVTGTVGQNKWIKTIWDNAKTTSGMDANDGRRPIIPANTKFTADKILLLDALEKIKEVEKDDYTYYGQDGMSIYEEQIPWYIGKMSTYIYCSRDYNVDCPMYHDDTTTLKVNGKIIYYKGHYVHEDTVPISFSKGFNKLEFYWTQVTTPNGVGFRTVDQLHDWEVVQKMNAYGYKYYTLSIKSQTPNIGATINNTGTGFSATSIPSDVDSGNVVLLVTMFDGTEIEKTFSWTKAKKGQTGNAGADGLTVLLTDENHSFAADTDHATAAETSTNVIAYKGSTQIATKITKIGNVSVSTSYKNTNITGLQAKVVNNNTTNTSISFKASTSLVTASGMIPIEMTVDERTFVRYYSFSLALKGQKGDTGDTGSAGKGISSTEITYKASDSGVTPPSGNDWSESVVEVAEGQFLWTKTYTTYTDGTHTTAYSVGRMGEDGTDGDDGVGITLTTIRYIESDQNQTPPDASANWQQSIPDVTPGNYLWTKTVFAYSDNSTKTIYSIARQGLNGTNGTDGIPGTSSYVHIKYSAVASPTDAQISEEPNTYIGICVDENQADPTTANSYTWSKLEGTDGNDGAPGRPGTDGTPAYVHFAYSTSADGQENFSTTSFSGALYIGVRADSTQQDSQVYSDYAWSLIKGEKGDTGTAAKLVDINATSQVFKCPTDSTTYSPTTIVLTPTFQGGISYSKWQYSTNGGSSWTNASSGSHGLTISSGKLTIQNSSDLYNSTTAVIFKCISNDSSYTDTITILKVKDGNTGSAGRGVSSTTVTYQVSNSGTTVPTGTWESSVQQTTAANPYLWTKTEITYTSGNPSVSYSVSKMGTDGNTGPQGTSVTITSKEVKYQSGASGTTAPTGTWISTIPSVSQGGYLWTRTIVNYSTGDSTTSYSVSYQGNDGSDGKGISTTSVTYQIGSNASVAPTGNWSSTVQTPTDEKPYLWTKTLITYTDSTETTSYSVSKKGADGQTGPQGPQGESVTITTKEISYVANSDGSTPPSSGWDTNFPTVNTGQYLWTRTYILYSTGEESTSYSVGYEGINGTSPYNVILSNESQTIAANASGKAVATTLTTNVIAYEGTTQIKTNVGTISGLPTGITAQINNNNETNTSITFTVTTSLQTQTGQITIPVTVATGVTINKHFSYSLSKTGTAAKLVDVTASALAFKCATNSSTYNPASIVLTPLFQGDISYKRWEISTDGGSTYTTAPGDHTGITIASSNPRTLTVTNSSSVFDNTSSVSFRCVSSSTSYTDTVTILKVKDGDKGEKGDKGDTGDEGNGISSTEIAYAISNSGASAPTNASDWGNFQEPTTAKPYLWTRTITHYTQSSDKTVYTVSKKGADGNPGRSILAVQEFYKKTATSSVPAIDNTWVTPPTAIPVVDATNKYLWNYEKITYSSGTLEENKGPRMIGMYSKDGNTGKGISSIVNKYLATNLDSGVTKNTTGWSTDPSTQTMDATKQFLWNYEIITYTDSTTSETDPCIIGKFGVDGTSVTITSQSVAYYNIGKTDNNTPPAENNSGWKSTMAAVNPTKGDFIWTRTIVNYSDSTKTVSYSKSYQGSDGTSPYNIILSNEAQTVAATAAGYVAQETNVTTNIIAYQGATQVATTVGTITTGVTGLEAQISSNGSTSTSITFTFRTTMNTQTGQVAIPITVGSTTITKYFSYSLSPVGATGTSAMEGYPEIAPVVRWSFDKVLVNENNKNYFPENNYTANFIEQKGTIGSENGKAIFNGSQVVRALNTLDLNDDFSISFWLNLSQTGTETILQNRKATGSGFSIFITNNKIRLDIGKQQHTFNFALSTNQLYHIVLKTDFTANTVSLYVDGIFKQTINSTFTTDTFTNYLWIGQSSVSGISWSGNSLYASLDDLRIYDYLLTQDNINYLYRTKGQEATNGFMGEKGNKGDKGDTGDTGPKGDDALLVDIVPSAQLFKSTDGGTTFAPSEITLTPRLQNVSFSNWQYSVNGGASWETITNTTSSQTNCYYDNNNVLHIPVGYTQYTDSITAITFKCNASGAASIFDTMTIAKLYDVTELDIGGRNLFKYTAYKRITTGTVPTASANGAVSMDTSIIDFSSISTTNYVRNGNNTLVVLEKAATSTSLEGHCAYQACWNDFIVGKNLFFSCYIYNQYNNTDIIFSVQAKGGEVKTVTLPGGEWTKVEIDLGPAQQTTPLVYYRFNTSATLYINSMKLEYGNMATEWTPAPEDVDNKIDEETDPEKVVAEINATGNTVQISGAHINFNGVAMFNSLSASNDATPHTIINGGEIIASILQSTNYTLNNIATNASTLSVGTDLSDVTLSFREIITYADAPFDGWSDGNYIIFETDNYYMKYMQSSDNNSFSQNLSIYTSDNVLLSIIYSYSTGEEPIEKETYIMPSDSGEVIYINNIHNICDSIGVARKINIGDDLSEATINLDYTWESIDTFEYLFPRNSNGSFVIFKTSGGYTLQYEKGVNPATAEINPNMRWDEISLYDKNHTLVVQLYGADSKWGKLPYPTISTYVLPTDCGRVVYSDPTFDSDDRISAVMIHHVATAGMKIDLNNGTIDSKNFVVNSKGDILIAGQLRSMQDNLLFGSETFDIFDDYGGLLMEINSYGMAFYGGSENGYIGSIGEMTQMMNVAIPLTPEQIEEDWPQEYQLEECPGLCIAAKPQTKDGLTPNYFVALGLANSNNEISPLVQVSGYPYLDVATELHWTVDLGPVSYFEDTNYCSGMRITSGEVPTFFFGVEGEFCMYGDPELTDWYISYGGTINFINTPVIKFSRNLPDYSQGIYWDVATNDYARIIAGGSHNAGFLEIATADDAGTSGAAEPIYVRQYQGTFTTAVRSATLLGSSGNTHFPGEVYGGGDRLVQGPNVWRLTMAGSTYLEVRTIGNYNGHGAWGIDVWASDVRLKKDIKDTEVNALDVIKQIRHIDFKYKYDDSHIKIGYLADQLQEIDEQMIFEVGEEKLKQPQESYIVPLLSKGIQEQQEQIDNLQQIIEDLQQEITLLKGNN